ncbi:MAG: serine/threonine-protein kinase, partial [Gemmatimonadota bacterium]
MQDILERLQAALQGKYLIERVLGEGGMATVVLAMDQRLERRVAIKVFRPELAVAVGPERFLSEIRTTAGLQHPHILQLYDSGQADGLLYYVMPFVDGETLRGRIDREGQLAVEDAVRIATEVAHGLDAAHAAGFVHRDVKPENILLGPGGALIADFGIALAVSGADTERLTKTGLSVGTPRYMSPEQATGDQKVDARTDVYSLGCVLYEMLVGEPPHGGRSVQAIMAAILSGEVPSARLRRGTIPANVDAAVRCAIERLPADRFDSCRAFAAALADPAFRHGTDPTEAPARALRRWKFATGIAAVAFLLTAGSVLWSRVRRGAVVPPPVSRFSIPFRGVEGYASGRSALAISADGSHVAFVDGGTGRDRLFLRVRDQLDSWVVPGSTGALDPFF